MKSGWRGLPDMVAAIEALGACGHGIHADVTNAGAVQNMVAETIERFGRADALVNNATYPRAADRVPLVDLDEALWRKVIDINLSGTMIVSKYVAKQMIAQRQGGSIVSISSIAAMVAPAAMGAYAASKAAEKSGERRGELRQNRCFIGASIDLCTRIRRDLYDV